MTPEQRENRDIFVAKAMSHLGTPQIRKEAINEWHKRSGVPLENKTRKDEYNMER